MMGGNRRRCRFIRYRKKPEKGTFRLRIGNNNMRIILKLFEQFGLQLLYIQDGNPGPFFFPQFRGYGRPDTIIAPEGIANAKDQHTGLHTRKENDSRPRFKA